MLQFHMLREKLRGICMLLIIQSAKLEDSDSEPVVRRSGRKRKPLTVFIYEMSFPQQTMNITVVENS